MFDSVFSKSGHFFSSIYSSSVKTISSVSSKFIGSNHSHQLSMLDMETGEANLNLSVKIVNAQSSNPREEGDLNLFHYDLEQSSSCGIPESYVSYLTSCVTSSEFIRIGSASALGFLLGGPIGAAFGAVFSANTLYAQKMLSKRNPRNIQNTLKKLMLISVSGVTAFQLIDWKHLEQSYQEEAYQELISYIVARSIFNGSFVLLMHPLAHKMSEKICKSSISHEKHFQACVDGVVDIAIHQLLHGLITPGLEYIFANLFRSLFVEASLENTSKISSLQAVPNEVTFLDIYISTLIQKMNQLTSFFDKDSVQEFILINMALAFLGIVFYKYKYFRVMESFKKKYLIEVKDPSLQEVLFEKLYPNNTIQYLKQHNLTSTFFEFIKEMNDFLDTHETKKVLKIILLDRNMYLFLDKSVDFNLSLSECLKSYRP